MSTHEKFTLFWKGPFSQWYPSNFKSFPMFKTTDFNPIVSGMIYFRKLS